MMMRQQSDGVGHFHSWRGNAKTDTLAPPGAILGSYGPNYSTLGMRGFLERAEKMLFIQSAPLMTWKKIRKKIRSKER